MSTDAWVHPTALVEKDVSLGEGTKIWDNVHIRYGAKLGRSCIVGEKTYIAYEVSIGNYVKINASVYICANVVIEDFCMIAAHTVFTNDRFPRAGNRELTGLETSDVTDDTLLARVRRGTTIGANATIGPGITLGEFSMIGMGAVVTKDIPSHAVVIGNPARQVGWVCVCGHPIREVKGAPEQSLRCSTCQRHIVLSSTGVQIES